jgi:hypothetical protein
MMNCKRFGLREFLSQNFPAGTEESNGRPQPGKSVSRARFEPSTFLIRLCSLIARWWSLFKRLKAVGCEIMECIQLAHDRDQWLSKVSQCRLPFLSSWATVRFQVSFQIRDTGRCFRLGELPEAFFTGVSFCVSCYTPSFRKKSAHLRNPVAWAEVCRPTAAGCSVCVAEGGGNPWQQTHTNLVTQNNNRVPRCQSQIAQQQPMFREARWMTWSVRLQHKQQSIAQMRYFL